VLTYLAKFDVIAQDDFPAMERLLWCGEVLPTPVLAHWMRRLPHVRFTNLYGPTEATIASSYYTVPSCPEDETASIPIGTPCAGEDLLVLDEELEPTAPGDIGDLYISGAGLSPGYWRDAEKTEAAFITRPSGRIYRTGDLARRAEDGLVHFLGRADSQIKSRGYRIELGEIEAAVNAQPGVRECAVVGVDVGGVEGTTICCAFSVADGVDVAPLALRAAVSALLPAYMLPTRWRELDALPKNVNGKIDRSRLRSSFTEESAAPGRPVIGS
jgi:acyl-coenzyme A synthetase/AMP-(fatty) acid ligase